MGIKFGNGNGGDGDEDSFPYAIKELQLFSGRRSNSTTNVLHGLDSAKIVGINVVFFYENGKSVSNAYHTGGWWYDWWFDTTKVYITLRDADHLTNKSVKIIIFYKGE